MSRTQDALCILLEWTAVPEFSPRHPGDGNGLKLWYFPRPMARLFLTACALLTVMVEPVGVAQAAAPTPTPGTGPGWTGVTNPQDVITARQELMEHIENLMQPIDTIQVKRVEDPDKLRSTSETLSAMLLAVPHLFPPTTNLYDPRAQMPVTLALPAIWKDFGTFYRLAAAAATAAQAMAATQGDEPLRAASRRLRASCDSCHALYLRPYAPPKVLDSDYRFDFDAALRKK
ncbi:MAG TPA: cytochrome c [Steroidobacteraceae bacterium]|nr:cytochrome c [Steroidobacteraceae bacterium]